MQESIKAIETSSDKAIELHKLSEEIIQKKDFKKIPRLYELLDEVENMADYWNTRTITADRQDESALSVVRAYSYVTEMTARMRLDIGDVHKEAGQFDKAKKIYRSVITEYTGERYKSEVKKAEFALEDLKEFEKKGKQSKKSSKPVQKKN